MMMAPTETLNLKKAILTDLALAVNPIKFAQSLGIDPAALCSKIVLQYCIDHNLNHDRKTALILGQRFGEFVNGTAADTFLRLTGGKPLNLSEEVKKR